ncbi:DnaT-like ssDNA-binding domain-containing protein [Buchnera aphidicola]|uniref:DnaT-like ssDNA-binding domain-containing protein n=1 Tax=Buchnera aphidicola TaxID=9 RepID=UPI0031B8291A
MLIGTNLKNFLKNPLKILKKIKKKKLIIFKKKIPIMYILNIKTFNKLLKYKIKYKNYKKKIKKTEKNKKFIMHKHWKPDKNFLKQASLWGIKLYKTATKTELASFISYWNAEKRSFYHIQWQQKLARNLQQIRNMINIKKKNINNISKLEYKIPYGFRGE